MTAGSHWNRIPEATSRRGAAASANPKPAIARTADTGKRDPRGESKAEQRAADAPGHRRRSSPGGRHSSDDVAVQHGLDRRGMEEDTGRCSTARMGGAEPAESARADRLRGDAVEPAA